MLRVRWEAGRSPHGLCAELPGLRLPSSASLTKIREHASGERLEPRLVQPFSISSLEKVVEVFFGHSFLEVLLASVILNVDDFGTSAVSL